MTVYVIQNYQECWGTAPPALVTSFEEISEYLRQKYLDRITKRDKYGPTTVIDILIEKVPDENFWVAYKIFENTSPREEWGLGESSWTDADFIIHEVEIFENGN